MFHGLLCSLNPSNYKVFATGMGIDPPPSGVGHADVGKAVGLTGALTAQRLPRSQAAIKVISEVVLRVGGFALLRRLSGKCCLPSEIHTTQTTCGGRHQVQP